MDAYAFVRETTREGLDRLAALVGDESGVVSFVPLIGAYAAFVKISDEDPGVVRRAFDSVAKIDELMSVDTFVGSSPGARGDVDVAPPRTGASRLSAARLSQPSADLWGLDIPPISPIPMPMRGGVGTLVAFVQLTTEPGATTEVYAQISTMPGVVGAAVIAGPTVGVLVEITAEDEHALAFAAETVASATGVDEVSISVGVTRLGAGLKYR
ncbi:MAG TPA: hypothetical protein VNB94_09850 [Mycobacteriales bacterium]|nr:hypothetical protein [Mycobacteriales bacterium]